MIKILGNSMALASAGFPQETIWSPEQLEARIRESALFAAPVTVTTALQLYTHVSRLTLPPLMESAISPPSRDKLDEFRNFTASITSVSDAPLPEHLKSFLVSREFLESSTHRANAGPLHEFMKFLEYIDGAHFASANKDQMALRKYKFFIPDDQNHLFPVPGAGSSIAKLFIGPSDAELERSFHVTTARMFEILVDPSIILAALENLSPEDLETFYQEIQGSWDGLYERCCNEPWFDEIEYLFDDSQIASILRQPIIDKLRELLGLPTQQ